MTDAPTRPAPLAVGDAAASHAQYHDEALAKLATVTKERDAALERVKDLQRMVIGMRRGEDAALGKAIVESLERDEAEALTLADARCVEKAFLEDELAEREAEIARLREALAPFAVFIEKWNEKYRDDPVMMYMSDDTVMVRARSEAKITLGDYRRASAAFFAPVTETPEPTAAQRAACLFAKTQADASGKPQSEVNAIVRESLENMAAKDVTEKEPTDGE